MSAVQQSSAKPSILSLAGVLALSGTTVGGSLYAYSNQEKILEFVKNNFKTINVSFDAWATKANLDNVVSAVTENVKTHYNVIGIAALGTLASCIVVFRGKHPKTGFGITATAATTTAVLASLVKNRTLDNVTWDDIQGKIGNFVSQVGNSEVWTKVKKLIINEEGNLEMSPYAPHILAGAAGLCFGYKIARWINRPSEFQLQLKKAQDGDLEALKEITNFKYLKGLSNKNQKEVLDLLLSLPADKDGIFNNLLGCMFYYGHGTLKDVARSNDHFFKAAKSGNADALFNIGLAFENGEAVIKDSKTAFEFYIQSAEKGCYKAMYSLIKCYDNGLGVERDPLQADHWRKQIVKGQSAIAA